MLTISIRLILSKTVQLTSFQRLPLLRHRPFQQPLSLYLSLQRVSTVQGSPTLRSVKICFLLVVSYNQPKLDPLATWSGNGQIFAGSSIIGEYPYGLFVNVNNTIYVADRYNNEIKIWEENSTSLSPNISGNLSNPHSLFVTVDGDIYVDNGYQTGGVDKFPFNETTSTQVMNVSQQCYSVFVDITNILYCSLMDLHQVVSTSLNNASQMSTIVAGTGCPGSTTYMLYYPRGIFVDDVNNFDLYVADCYNNRIQRFPIGQLNGQTVLNLGSFTLNCPTGVVLDARNYLFIVDSGHHRILGSGPYGFRCLVGCSGLWSSKNSDLYYPQTMAFDSYGNFFVTDMHNHRVQKFILLNNSLGKS